MGAGIQPHTRLGRSHALDFLIVRGNRPIPRPQLTQPEQRVAGPRSARTASACSRRQERVRVLPTAGARARAPDGQRREPELRRGRREARKPAPARRRPRPQRRYSGRRCGGLRRLSHRQRGNPHPSTPANGSWEAASARCKLRSEPEPQRWRRPGVVLAARIDVVDPKSLQQDGERRRARGAPDMKPPRALGCTSSNGAPVSSRSDPAPRSCGQAPSSRRTGP